MRTVKWYKKGGDGFEKGFAEALKIRGEVFSVEQGFCEDKDETDDIAEHIVVYIDSAPVATGRIFPAHDGIYKMGRIAVLKSFRQTGTGAFLVDEMVKRCKERGAGYAKLGAQKRVEKFYLKCGFIRTPDDFYYEEYCPHVDMIKKLV